jgi:phosphoribosylaminoimidazole carboxylase (NCAIR synthetase)
MHAFSLWLPMLDEFCLYGKSTMSPFRKMGHLTVAADTVEAAVALGHRVKGILRVVSGE